MEKHRTMIILAFSVNKLYIVVEGYLSRYNLINKINYLMVCYEYVVSVRFDTSTFEKNVEKSVQRL